MPNSFLSHPLLLSFSFSHPSPTLSLASKFVHTIRELQLLILSSFLTFGFFSLLFLFPPPRFILGDLSRLCRAVRLLRGSAAACAFTPTTGAAELAHGGSLSLSALAARSSISNDFALSSSLFLPTESNFVACVRQCLAAARRHSIRKVSPPSIIAADVASLQAPLSLQSSDGELAVEQLLQTGCCPS